MQRDAALVLETTEITPGVFVTWYDAPSLAAGATPGQFVMVDPGWETGSFDPLLPRAFSYYRFRRADGVEGERQFALLYAVVGRVTEAMARQQPGDQLWMTGPLGRGFEVNRNARSLLLVGGGVGVAPLVALADQEVERGRSIVLCFGARAAAGVFPAGLLPPQVEYYVSTEDGSLGQEGPGHRAVRRAPRLGRPVVRLRSRADVPQHGLGGARRRHAPRGADSDGDGDGLRHGHLLRLRRLHSSRRQALLPRRPPLRPPGHLRPRLDVAAVVTGWESGEDERTSYARPGGRMRTR